MSPFPLHLGRAISIQIAVEGHPCLDELHESDMVGVCPGYKQCSNVYPASWGCLPDNDLVTFICTPTLWFYVAVWHVGGADGHNSFPLGHPGCPTMPCNGMSLSRWMLRGLALPQVTLFHILIGNWFRSVSFQPTSIAAPPPEYTPPAAKVQALSFRLPYTRTGCQSIFLKRRPIRSFFLRVMHNKHEKISYLNICL